MAKEKEKEQEEGKLNSNGQRIYPMRVVTYADLHDKYGDDAGHLYNRICRVGGFGNFQSSNRPDLALDGMTEKCYQAVQEELKNADSNKKK